MGVWSDSPLLNDPRFCSYGNALAVVPAHTLTRCGSQTRHNCSTCSWERPKPNNYPIEWCITYSKLNFKFTLPHFPKSSLFTVRPKVAPFALRVRRAVDARCFVPFGRQFRLELDLFVFTQRSKATHLYDALIKKKGTFYKNKGHYF